jgi:hypothetical protein
MKSNNRKADAVVLNRTLYTDELTHWEIQQALVGLTIEDIKNIKESGYPLLHEACTLSFSYIGARRLLLVFFEDSTLRPLFADPTYTDGRGWTPIALLMQMNGNSVKSTGWCILDDIFRKFGCKNHGINVVFH